MQFEPHGDMKLTWVNHILLLEVCGQVNFEGAQRFNRLICDSVNKRNPAHWVRMERFHGDDSLGTPESFTLLEQSMHFSKQTGCHHLVLVNSGLLIRDIFTQCGKDAGIACHCANTMFDAMCLAHNV